jgi:prephenate dehydrogenase
MSDVTAGESLSERVIAIVGVGLIGGSIAAALKRRNFAGEVLGVGRNASRLEAARERGLIDRGSTDLAEAARQADLLVFCTPVDLIAAGVREAAGHCRPGTLITDAGSAKQAICRELAAGLPDEVQFIGSHPLAGSEKQGYEYAEADLFVGRLCVVTPVEPFDAAALERLVRFWRALGSEVTQLTPAVHDRIVARTSHLPHVVAAALASLLPDSADRFAASGFHDTTRIASGDPALWTAIVLANAEEILSGLDEMSGRLQQYRDTIAAGDRPGLHKRLELGKTKRDRLINSNTDRKQ